ncbi:cytochrome b/b6 domain-containing protein [Microbacterium amylolyticum]|uniref:Thiosulfate reductase cytochrome b subunit n=1 Tax=Microbacterium amylolyticum TaxID=936337 RepID=A0ABS4ZH96_9MICO|nr:cytochrome b/b6 domain-containing protein [Microbacterium amylolyticum]MBP2436661.1 thiosulfate reductase cytochrome b subunit [Microbacterium amylolyticum]
MSTNRPRPTWIQVVVGLFGAAAIVLLCWIGVFTVRALLGTPELQSFITTYPGGAPIPEGTKEGIPAFVSWTHFLNAFFLVLIIRTGIRVRTEKRAGGLWSSKKVKKRRMSLALWGHLAVDVLWLVNGVVFVVLLFASGHWVRIVPTSWDVFPNALSTLIQYVSLDWPTEHSWANYNALQQLMYFAIVFFAAPVAAVTGWRLSAFAPKSPAWERAFPVHVAKRLHFPTMLFFVGFVIVHVGLVFATGALRNLNHMYAGTDSVSWTGFGIFSATVVLMVIGWGAVRRDDWIARPAKWFGDVRLMKR